MAFARINVDIGTCDFHESDRAFPPARYRDRLQKTWDQLDATGQESLREACISAQKELRNGLDERLQETRKIAEEGGITVIDDVDKAAFEALLTPLYGRLLGSAPLLKLARRIQDER